MPDVLRLPTSGCPNSPLTKSRFQLDVCAATMTMSATNSPSMTAIWPKAIAASVRRTK
jgi:hypothetical protein